MYTIPGKHSFTLTIFLFIVLSFFCSCAGSKVGSASQSEGLNMDVTEEPDLVDFNQLKEQEAPTLAARGRNKSRGAGLFVGGVVSLASNAVKNVIAREKQKYFADYQFALTDLYFYDQLSNEGPFDPVGMQFAGFNLLRTFNNKAGNIDTAFTASFSLDTSRAYEILNNSVFRLRLDDFNLRYAKAKVATGETKQLNMDIEIVFRASYVNQYGVLFDNVTLGKFYLFIRNAPLDKTAPNYEAYYKGLKGQLLTGRSFIVPRSYGYHIENGEAKPGYSQGAYTVDVTVKESSKNLFESKLITDNTDLIIDSYKEKAIRYINSNLPGH